MKPVFKRTFVKREALHKINELITAENVRVVGDIVPVEVYPTSKVLEIAYEMGLDLVEISPNSDPPVCKIVDYKKFLYEQKKKQKEIKANAVKQEVKEIRFGPNTNDHDIAFKIKHSKNFLEQGHKVRAYVFFRGRTIIYKQRGIDLLMGYANTLIEEGYAKLEIAPKEEGKKVAIVLAPKPKNINTIK
ncbi:MAG: translation initiation factor IF-3 [Flavobacteriaceae bacterium]|nr:translation initiation factor IF-3 [Flavobacteriaceae bacterium]